MTTSAMLGVFREEMMVRMEFLDSISRSSEPFHL